MINDKQAGFTLTELMITLVISGMLLSLTVLSLHHLIDYIRLSNATRDLHNAMNLTRIEAIKRNSKVTLIARDGSWTKGWIIQTDQHTIFQHPALHDDIQVSSTFKNKAKPYIAYNGAGRTRTDTNNNASLYGNIRLSIGDQARVIVVNSLGRVRICNPAITSVGNC